jgi:ribosome-associated translation inhibitor RaiA
MQIDIQARDFSLTDSLHDYAETRLRFALTASHSHIKRISMRLSDVNGPRGGTDKLCHIKVTLTTLPDVIIRDIESDMYAAINRAADRAGRNVQRKIRRKQTIGRKAQPLLVNA